MFQCVLLSATLPFDLCFPSLFPVFPSLFLSLTPCPAVLSLSVFLLFHTTTRPFLCALSILLCSLIAVLMLPVSHSHSTERQSPALIFLPLFVCLDVLLFLFQPALLILDNLCSLEICCSLNTHPPVLQNMVNALSCCA